MSSELGNTRAVGGRSGEVADAPVALGHTGAIVVLVAVPLLLGFDVAGVNVGLPEVQRDLRMSSGDLDTLYSAYRICFGALPVLAGALGLAFGRRLVLRLGLLVFGLGAVLAATAGSALVLIGARATQGAGAALATAGGLALIDTSFRRGRERNRALVAYFAVAAGAAAVALFLSANLVELGDWKWPLYADALVAGALLLGTGALAESTGRSRAGLGRAVLYATGLVLLTRASALLSQVHWQPAVVIAVTAALSTVPMLAARLGAAAWAPPPLARLFHERARLGAYCVVALLAAGFFGLAFPLTIRLQLVDGLSPIATARALLPVALTVLLSALLLPALARRLGLRAVAAGAAALCALGLARLATVGAGASYATDLLPALLLVAFGAGVVALPVAFADGGSGARPTGLNSSRQLGQAIGVTMASGLFVYAQTHAAVRPPSGGALSAQAMVVARVAAALRPVQLDFWLVAALAAAAALIALCTLPGPTAPVTE
ncbi:MFS transporter [Kitasatospora nipponensis]|uniref:MFS transporter n=1 Tax=Kitasatospora nipponensis TaxID=258049 RepID=A0ABN3IEM0_9ACTN